MTSESQLVSLLKEQLRTYRVFHELLNRERTCLVEMNASAVEDISREKDTVLLKLRLLEEERQRLIEDFRVRSGTQGPVNLEELGRITGNNDFSALRTSLLSVIQGIDEMNKFNGVLIDRSLNHIRTTNSFINLFHGDRDARPSGILISKET